MNLVELSGITKQYELGRTRVEALRGVDLKVARGEFTVVMGPSGSGKSTLLNIIGCLDRPSSGQYLLEGKLVSDRDFDDLAEIRNYKIGFIFQSFNLIPVLDVVENVEFPCLMRREREPSRALRDRVLKLADQVGLTPYLHHKPDELSGGQRQRVAIARALVTQPQLVLADEPTANLDSVTGQNIIDLMKEMNRKQGTTFIFSTHDYKVVQNASAVIKVADGKFVERTTQVADVMPGAPAPVAAAGAH